MSGTLPLSKDFRSSDMSDARSRSGDNPPRRVVLLTASIGAGHNSVARAVAEELRRRWPALDVETIDLVDCLPKPLRPLVQGFHTQGMTRWPRVFGFLYHSANRRRRPGFSAGERFKGMLSCQALCSLQRRLRESPPGLVLHTYWMGVPVVGNMLARERPAWGQAVVVTDVLPHRVWYSPHVDRWFVAACESVARLRDWGVAEASITVGGIPVRAAWDAPLDVAHVRQAWKLPPDRDVVVLTGGATFTVGGIAGLSRRLLSACPEVALVVLCGTNGPLCAELQRLPQSGSTLFAVPFTDRAHELVRCAAVLVTKPGGVTMSECLAAGTPMVLMPPVPGQESENAVWLDRHSAARGASNADEIPGLVRRTLDDLSARDALRRAARALYRPGREIVTQYVGDRLGLHGP